MVQMAKIIVAYWIMFSGVQLLPSSNLLLFRPGQKFASLSQAGAAMTAGSYDKSMNESLAHPSSAKNDIAVIDNPWIVFRDADGKQAECLKSDYAISFQIENAKRRGRGLPEMTALEFATPSNVTGAAQKAKSLPVLAFPEQKALKIVPMSFNYEESNWE